MTDSVRQRLGWADTGRGIAIVLVPLYHAVAWLQSIGVQIPYWTPINEVLSSMRMPLFFALSGLFAVKWLTAKWSDLFRTKLMLFWWVFAVWEVIGTIAIVLGLLAQGQPVGLGGQIKALLISPVWPKFELWFIWALALMFIAARALVRIDYRIQLVATGIMSSITLAIWLNSNNGWNGFAKYFFFFLAGMYLREQMFAAARMLSRVTLAAGVLVCWAALSVTLSLLEIRHVYPLYFVNCVLGVAAGVAISQRIRLPLLARLGRNTLAIYVAHTPVVIMTVFLISTLGAVDLVGKIGWIAPVLLAAGSIAAALGIHRVLISFWGRYLYEVPPVLLKIAKGHQ